MSSIYLASEFVVVHCGAKDGGCNETFRPENWANPNLSNYSRHLTVTG